MRSPCCGSTGRNGLPLAEKLRTRGCVSLCDPLGSTRVKLALSILCEHPGRRTGLTTLFHEFISHALPLYPEIDWIVFAGPNQPWLIDDPRVQVVRRYPANDQLPKRLLADHFLVPAAARRLGAAALLTVGFVPVRKSLPVAMHLFSLQHLSAKNRVGFARQVYRRLIVNRSVDRAELIIVNSRFAETQFLHAFPAARERTVVSYEGLQHDQFTPDEPPGEAAALRAEFAVEPGYLLWVSNFYDYKQADRLLAGYARLPAAQRAAHPLVMVGGGWHGGMDAARAHTAALGIADDVRFLGWVDDRWLAPLYRHARLFCLGEPGGNLRPLRGRGDGLRHALRGQPPPHHGRGDGRTRADRGLRGRRGGGRRAGDPGVRRRAARAPARRGHGVGAAVRFRPADHGAPRRDPRHAGAGTALK